MHVFARAFRISRVCLVCLHVVLLGSVIGFSDAAASAQTLTGVLETARAITQPAASTSAAPEAARPEHDDEATESPDSPRASMSRFLDLTRAGD
jgi:hypothetical protein